MSEDDGAIWEDDGKDVIFIARDDGTLVVNGKLSGEERRWLLYMLDRYGVEIMLERARSGGLIVAQTPPINTEIKRVVGLAAKNRLPAIYADANWADAGGFMSYSTDTTDVYRRAATYVDKILKGIKPADLPVERPMKFELVINLKTAKQIGLTIPPNVLARADRVIR